MTNEERIELLAIRLDAVSYNFVSTFSRNAVKIDIGSGGKGLPKSNLFVWFCEFN